MSAIALTSVSKTFRQGRRTPVRALDGISLRVEAGEVFGFVGPNGAGKSTTIKAMLNIITDYAGEISLFGVPARDAAARRAVGYVPEAPALYEQLTPLEILRAGLDLHGVRRDHPDNWCLSWLERFSIAHVARRKVRELSKGTVQRTALAHALAVSPRLLILDEPLSGLDPVGRKDVVEILAEYRKEGGTIFLTSHVLHDVERLANRFGLIHKGELKTIQSPNELVGDHDLVTVRSFGPGPLSGLEEESGGRYFAEIRRPALWPLLQRLEAAGHTLIEVKPTLTLESAFMRYLGLEKGGGNP
ncbi:MAG: ABC transporter ATP-binding protein [Proteobacteria bacterium]|nr:ABC transporter ATP-binding protein [Pseudomonadota bacterium]HQR03994.1 ABC transporter ATP-binding protein [Rhodocyclaceae bacterium]